jgi:hypothetical protein
MDQARTVRTPPTFFQRERDRHMTTITAQPIVETPDIITVNVQIPFEAENIDLIEMAYGKPFGEKFAEQFVNDAVSRRIRDLDRNHQRLLNDIMNSGDDFTSPLTLGQGDFAYDVDLDSVPDDTPLGAALKAAAAVSVAAIVLLCIIKFAF